MTTDWTPENLKRRVEEHLKNTPPEQIVAQAQSILRELRNCAHVPRRPDTDFDICEKCDAEIVADADTHLWRPLTHGEKWVAATILRDMPSLPITRHFSPELLKRLTGLFIVRLYDGMDNQWIDVFGPAYYDEANKIWLEKTKGGTEKICFDEIDYYKVFPADTKMLYSEGFGER